MRNFLSALALFASTGCVIVVPEVAKEYNSQCVDAIGARDLAQADVLCDHALEYQDRYWDALHNKGLIALPRGDEKSAKAFFMRAIRANGDMAQSYMNLGVIALNNADFANARDNELAALRINPEYAEARHNLGLAYLRLNRLDEAEKTFRHMVAAQPQASQGYANVGAVLMQKQQPAEAVRWFDEALGIEVKYSAAWKGKALALEAMGQRDAAREAFESCLEFAEGDLECQAGMQRLQ